MQSGFSPIYALNTQTMILGSAPSTGSLKKQEYYGGPGNQFWPILASFYHFSSKESYALRCSYLLNAQLGLWDVFDTFERIGSLDVNFKETSLNPIEELFYKTHLKLIILNGKKATSILKKNSAINDKLILSCPSTSGANNAQKKLREKQWFLALTIHEYINQSPLKMYRLNFGNVSTIRRSVFQLRELVFVGEQGIDTSLEFDNIDENKNCDYFLLSDEQNQPIATIRYQKKDNQTIQPDRFCVNKKHRKQGIGQALLTIYELYALFEGYQYSELSAEENALSFYLKLGYNIISNAFIEDGISCYKVRKTLTI